MTYHIHPLQKSQTCLFMRPKNADILKKQSKESLPSAPRSVQDQYSQALAVHVHRKCLLCMFK